jgi:hypothetical protein
LTTYFKDTAVTFKELETISMSLKDNAKIIVPQGNTISLILSELDHTRQVTPRIFMSTPSLQRVKQLEIQPA